MLTYIQGKHWTILSAAHFTKETLRTSCIMSLNEY